MSAHRPSNDYQAYCEVIAHHGLDAVISPARIRIAEEDAHKIMLPDENNAVLHISYIQDIRQAASLKAGGQGIRYTCETKEFPGQIIYLFNDDGFWYIEIADCLMAK